MKRQSSEVIVIDSDNFELQIRYQEDLYSSWRAMLHYHSLGNVFLIRYLKIRSNAGQVKWAIRTQHEVELIIREIEQKKNQLHNQP